MCVCWCVAVKNKELRLNVESSRLRLSLPLFLHQQCASLCLCTHTQCMCECVLLCRHAESSCTVMNVLCETKGRAVLNTPAWHPPQQQQQLRHVVWRQFNDSTTLLTLPPKTASVWHLNPLLSTPRKYQQWKVFLMFNDVMWLSNTAARCPK